MSDPVTFKSLLVGTRFRFAATPHGKTYKKVGLNQFRVANHPHIFRAENETQVVPLPDLPGTSANEFLPLARASRGKCVSSAKDVRKGEGA
ncbi:hypothetical protein [Acetobacter lovaniensis]|uniref:Uncharacterized protein n=1 Tax=Acetobacter lovaniensis TaxID=104100 RepID=A0A841QIN1_9PROT|nr:hypothetical protein [Acetobacter lovaniensis]MBB6458451.1 hypothetical protein [Acetobacter lovaniensis]NHN82674.1 hypothetical protein [Acetobacter lovaniensis]GBQ74547.1 hypothetical protein AA0474_3243 [Acetobacter lovaniensis NRIC 0474]